MKIFLLIIIMIAIWDTLVFAIKRIKRYERYNHHGCYVWVRKDLKGKHRDHCLCWDCEDLQPMDRVGNCPIANALFENCVNFNVVTPVYECPKFKRKETQ